MRRTTVLALLALSACTNSSAQKEPDLSDDQQDDDDDRADDDVDQEIDGAAARDAGRDATTMDRRDGGAADLGHEAAKPDASADTRPERDPWVGAIIDTHTHFWDPQRPPPEGRDRPIPWPGPNDSLYRRTLPADFVALARPLGITATVVVEASSWLEDNDWILGLAERNDVIVGLVGNLGEVLGKPSFAATLARLGANARFAGIRVGDGQVADALAGGATLADFQRLADANLAIDTLGVGFSRVEQLARKIPKLRIVIDHMGGVNVRNPGKDWFDGITLAAKQANVFIKVSGLVEGAGTSGARNAPSDPAVYKPVLDHVFAQFGEDRVLFASNWPVSDLFAPLATVFRIVEANVAGKSESARAKLFARNAVRVYGL